MASLNKNNFFSKGDLKKIVYEKELPTTWNKDNKITYQVLSEIFSFFEENSLTVEVNLVPVLNFLCNKDVSPIVRKPVSNFRKKMLNFVKIVTPLTIMS